jgi:hypothetical protein
MSFDLHDGFLCFYVKVGCMNIVTLLITDTVSISSVTEVDICRDARMQLTFLCASRCLHVEPVDM